MRVKSIAYNCVYFDTGAWIDFKSTDIYRGYADFKSIADAIWGVEFTEPLKFKATPNGFKFGNTKGNTFEVACYTDDTAPEVHIGYCDSKRDFAEVIVYTKEKKGES